MINWPKHLGGLHLTHNANKSYYESAKQVLDNDPEMCLDWISAEERTKAYENDSIWEIYFYPDTPVGFIRLRASTFEALMRSLEGNTL